MGKLGTRRISLLLALVLAAAMVFSASAVAADEDAAAVASDGDAAAGPVQTKLTIIHTNDAHSRTGAQAYIAALAKDLRAKGENVLVLSAGDELHGQPLATLPRGESIVTIMNAVGYDAMTPGNHDFNYGSRRLFELASKMQYPLLAANVRHLFAGQNSAFAPYIVKEFDGVKVGIFGLATPETVTKTNPSNVDTLIFDRPVQVADRVAATLKQDEGCDVVISLAHLGLDESTIDDERSTAIAGVRFVDVVIDGHSHTQLDNGMVTESGALIAQTGSYAENIGIVELTVADGKVTSKSARLVKPEEAGVKPDQAVLDIIARLEAANEEITSEVVGTATVNLEGERENVRTRETNLGNLITDSIIDATGADIALMNGGNIRATIPAGTITKGDVLTVLPFGNYVVVKQLSGAAILEAIEHGLKEAPVTNPGFPHVAGISVTYDASRPVGSRVVEAVLATGEEIDPNKTYSFATNDFLAEGGDGYEMIGAGTSYVIYGSMEDIFMAYLGKNPTMHADNPAAPSRMIPVGQVQKAAA